MSRFRRALAGAAMAVAMAGGGMVAAMAGAAPAHAATTPAPAASHAFSFTVVPAARAAGGIGPKFQCGDFCDPNGGNGNPPPAPTIITCTLSLMPPHLAGPSGAIVFHADTTCDGTLPGISQVQNVLYRGSVVDNDLGSGVSSAHTNNVEACSPGGQWQFFVNTMISLPPGWVVLSGTNPMNSSSPIVIFDCGGGSGGGGGCATGTPSVPAQPAARLPMVVTC
jgi:hypothetical protein